MSSEYLEDVEDDNENSVLLTYYVNGWAHLTILEDDKEGTIDSRVAQFSLSPNEKGWENALKISEALKEWVNHTKNFQ